MSAPRQIEIAGGGLAGLSLGIALRRHHVPVTLHEAGDYPRQKVCGEFIAGLDRATITQLQLEGALHGAQEHRDVAWFHGDRLIWRQRLPQVAWTLSRLDLDARLADEFKKLGGVLLTRSRVNPLPQPGWVDATGRRRNDSPWIGLKLHVRGITLSCGLELHLGADAYIGLCTLPGGAVNVCGLFRRRNVTGATRLELVVNHLRAAALETLANRLEAAVGCEDSEAAVAGLGFSPHRPPPAGVALGDAQGMLPPFMGNGMAAAFQSAALAVDPLLKWSANAASWEETAGVIRRRLGRRFFLRARLGSAMHAFVLSPARQSWLAALAARRCLPTRLLYRCLH
jgi:menaquinone-9 beta-reductase